MASDHTPQPAGRRRVGLRRAGTVVSLALLVGTAMWQAAPATATERDGSGVGASEPHEPADGHGRVLHGDVATAALERAPRLVADAVAHNLDRSLDELVDDLERDPTLFITTRGMAGHVDPATPQPSELHSAHAKVDLPPGLDVFDLASRPSSPLTIYLDLDGHLLDGELWNYYYDLPPTPLDAFDRDGDPTTFSLAEREEIYEIWLAVVDDFAPFDVNVTTVDPGTEALRRSGAGDGEYGSRLVVTGTNWRGSAGVAFLDVFDYVSDVSAFAFSDQLRTPSRVAHTASHEIGHTLGLGHDGYHTSEYYFGTSTWGPIMGGSGGAAIIQWSKGDYPGATRFEDDLDVIGSELPVLADDHGATPATATALNPSAPMTASGLIGGEHDVDVFDVGDVGSAIDLTIRPAVGTSNLHVRVEITDPGGTPIATLVPASRADWVLETELPAGRHLVSVHAGSWGTIPHGFPAYGALGAYSLDLDPHDPPTTPPTTTTTTAPTTPTVPPTTVPPTPTPTTPTTAPPTTTPNTGAKVNGPAGGPIEPAVRVKVPAAVLRDS